MTLTDLAIRDAGRDLLDRKRLADAVVTTIREPGLGTPLAVAIYGDWGSGKTSVMRMIEALLPQSQIRPLWFDAWRYARQAETLWRALLVAVVDALRAVLPAHTDNASQEAQDAREHKLDILIERLDHSRTDIEKGPARIDLKAGVTFALDLALRYATLGAATVSDLFGALKAEDMEKAAKIRDSDGLSGFE